MHHPETLYLIEDDPGIPRGSLDDPLAGLSERTVGALMEAVGYTVEESKAIGGAQLSGNVLARDTSLRQRYSTLTGTTQQRRVLKLSAKNAMRELTPFAETAQRELSGLMSRWQAGRISLSAMRTQSAAVLRRAYEGARIVGRKASGLARLGGDPEVRREEETWFRDAVREELRYWHQFLDEIQAGRVSEGRVQQRIDAYVRAVRFMFEAARVQALPDNVLLYWMGPKRGDPNICEGCALMMEWSPFPKSQIPAVPRDGSTPCLTNCRHRVVVRVARNFNDVVRRSGQLDRLKIETTRRPRSSQPRARMLLKLEEVKGRRSGRRVRGKAGNPFGRERLPESEALWAQRLMEGAGDAPDEAGRETIGVFIRVPTRIAAAFPKLPASEDTSTPHVTILFVGKANASEYSTVVGALRRMVHEHDIKPFVVEMTDYGEFSNPAGKIIPHMIPRTIGEPSLAKLHDLAFRCVQEAGIQPDHIRDGAFKPHVTLGYLPAGKRYDGPRPTGTWRVETLEVWGAGVWGKGDLGLTVIPLTGCGVAINEANIASPHHTFDSAPYSNMDLRDVGRLLVTAAKKRDVNMLVPVLDRLVSALEHTVLAVEGRPRAAQVAKQLRQAFVEMVKAFNEHVPESVVDPLDRLDRCLILMEQATPGEV